MILDIPFRKSTPLNFSGAVKQYISAKYDQHPDMFAKDIETIDKLRNDAINVREPHESGIRKLAHYAAQLQWIGGKFPIDIGADFTWNPALGYNTSTPITQNNLQFERANVLFNLAALYSQLATLSPRISDQGLKTACNYYSASAGVFKFLQESVIPELRSTPPEDMDVTTLECVEQLMLAQAQECFWFKAVIDGKNKDSVIARLAASVSDYYESAAEFGVKSTSIKAEWIHYMTAKHHHFAAAGQYRAACDCLERSKYGEEVARLKDALDAVNVALKEGKKLNATVLGDLMALKEKVSDALKVAERDNDMIYLCPVPPAASLPRLLRASMVSSRIPVEVSNGANMVTDGQYGPPLFAKLVPFSVHVAANIYAERRDRLINNSIIDEIEALTAQIHELLQSLNLPGSLQALEKPLGLPSGIIAHADEVRQLGGVGKIHASISAIDKLRDSDTSLYQEACDLLLSEAREDDELRLKYGTDRWTRAPSREAAGKLTAQVDEYASIITSAENTDTLVRRKLVESEHAIQLLGGRIHDLQEFVPNSTRPALTATMDREVARLRQCLNEISRLETRRKRQIETLREKAKQEDTTSAILAEASRLERTLPHRTVEPADFETFFANRLSSQYPSPTSVLSTALNEQSTLISALQAAHASFTAIMHADGSTKPREDALQRLENAYNRYKEIMTNLDVGRKFYNDLAKLLTRFCDECRSWVYARRLEAQRMEDELLNPKMSATTTAAVMDRLKLAPEPQIQPPSSQPQFHPQPQQPQNQPPKSPSHHVVPNQRAALSATPGLWKGDALTAIRFAPPSK